MLKYFCHEADGLVYKIHQNENSRFIVKIKKEGITVFVYESEEDDSLTIAILRAQMLYKRAIRSVEA